MTQDDLMEFNRETWRFNGMLMGIQWYTTNSPILLPPVSMGDVGDRKHVFETIQLGVLNLKGVCCDHLVGIIVFGCRFAGPGLLMFHVQQGLVNPSLYDRLLQRNANQCCVRIH